MVKDNSECEKCKIYKAIIAKAKERFSYIAYCSSEPGSGGSSEVHETRWLEKSAIARKTLEAIENIEKEIDEVRHADD